MTHQTKVLLKVFGILAGVFVVFLFGVSVGSIGSEQCEMCEKCEVCQECPECEPKIKEIEVEKIVYKDTKETLGYVNDLEVGMTNMTEGYITVFEIAEYFADIYGQPIHQDYYDLYNFSLEWQNI